MTLEEIVTDIRLSVAKLSERFEHTVTWKQLAGTSVALFLAICGGVWFLVGVIMESKQAESERRLKESITVAVDDARRMLLDELSVSFSGISNKIENQSSVISEVSATLAAQSSYSDTYVAKLATLDDLSSQVEGISGLLKAAAERPPAYVTVPAIGNLKSEVLSSPEWAAFSKKFKIQPFGIDNAGQVSIPIESLMLQKN